ncbi:MAG: hypothetical protein QOD77_172 [Thermoplasmata archaeon]|jgi:hypothetical protein|nr:hypothetical protein [Thermoplasmata archaeon]
MVNRKSASLPYVLAFLMVFSISQAIVPEAEAGVAPAGLMSVSVEPSFTTNVIMVKQGISAERLVRVSQGDPLNPMTTIEFVWFMRDDTSTPACRGPPRDLCATAVKFDWIKETSYAMRPGWKVEAATSTAAKILRFVSDGTQELRSGTPQDFNVAFSQRGAAQDDEYHIQVRGYCGAECQPGVAFETTCASTRAPEFTCIHTNPPFTGAAPIPAADCNAPCGQLPSLVLRIDSVPPDPPAVIMQDIDHNGHIDRFVADFPKKLDAKSFDARLFTLTARGRLFGSSLTDAGYTIQNAYFVNPDNPVRVVFLVNEMPYYDTGDQVNLRYAGTSLRDEAGNPLRGINVQATDRAPPVIVAAYGLQGYDGVHVTFSEPVVGTGNAQDPATGVGLQDLLFFDDGGSAPDSKVGCPAASPCVLSIADSRFGAITHQPGPRTGHQATIKTSINPVTSTPYTFGPNDVHPLKGDMLGVASSGAACAPGEDPPCDSKIKDAAGLKMWHPLTAPASVRHITRPLLVRAEVDIGSDALKLWFNGPVRAAKEPGVTTPQPISVSNMDIVTAAGTGVGPQGLIGDYFRAVDQDFIVVKLDAKARPTDVDATPTSIRPHCKKIVGSGLPETNDQAFLPCDNPDLFYEQEARVKGTGTLDAKGRDHDLPSPGAAFVDDTPPRIVQVRTVDTDHNGWLDGLELTMSEPVDDVTFCSNANTAPNFCPDSWTPVGGISQVGLVMMQNLRATDDRSQECLGLYRWETGLVVNDNVGIIKAINVERSPTGEYIVTSRDCVERYFNQDTGIRMDTGHLPTFTTTARGLFADLSVPENRMPQYCQLQRLTHFHHPDAATTKDCGLLASTKAQYTAPVSDGAPPVVMAARTVDTPAVNKDGIPDKPAVNLWGDGRIDGYRLTMSESVKDSTFDRRDWLVQRLGAAQAPIHEVNGFRSYDLNETLGALRSNDRELTVLFNPDTVPDTDARPELTYRRDPDSKGLADIVGNVMVDFDEFAVVEQDDSRPVIVGIEGYVGERVLTLHFSEPVDDGAQGKLVSEDFFYHNNDATTNPGGVAGKAVSNPETGQAVNVIHVPDVDCTGNLEEDADGCNEKAIIPLDRALTNSDLTTDRINAEKDTIYEKAPTVVPVQRKAVPNFQQKLSVGADVTPPAKVTDLRVQTDAVLANSVLLAWTAPADDSLAGGAVTSYVFKVSTSAIDPAGFDALVNPNGITPEFEPAAMAAVNQTQTLRLVGLNPTTQYHFAIRAVDEAGNAGGVSNAVTALTSRDATAPVGTLTVSSTSHKAGETAPKVQGIFSWNKLEDPESTVVYRYALTGSPAYQVLAADKSVTGTSVTVDIPSEGDWTFHVAAFSGGGSTPTAHFSFGRGSPVLAADAIAAANDRLKDNVEIVRKPVEIQDGVEVDLNTITWTLPPESDLPGTLEAIEIWRLDAGIPTLVTTQPGSYSELKSGNFTDVTQGADENSLYRVNMVFAQDQRQADPSVSGQFKALQNQTPGEIPAWVYVLAGIALALIIAGIIIYFVLRGRQKAAAAGGVAYSWESADPEALGIDEATGLPVHEVKCPSCNNPFQAVGVLPLPVTCPTCQTTGMLE